jgi:glycosyltransferase involved in cell wall biosynthesis
MAPMKGTHLAIAIARKAGIPLKLADEIQPVFRDYYKTEVEPQIDGKFVEYIGEADLAKNELLGNSLALLFPIQWNEPFGLVMIEAMACGTPVLALPGDRWKKSSGTESAVARAPPSRGWRSVQRKLKAAFSPL